MFINAISLKICKKHTILIETQNWDAYRKAITAKSTQRSSLVWYLAFNLSDLVFHASSTGWNFHVLGRASCRCLIVYPSLVTFSVVSHFPWFCLWRYDLSWCAQATLSPNLIKCPLDIHNYVLSGRMLRYSSAGVVTCISDSSSIFTFRAFS